MARNWKRWFACATCWTPECRIPDVAFHDSMMDEIIGDHTIPETSGRALTLQMDNKPLKRIDKIGRF